MSELDDVFKNKNLRLEITYGELVDSVGYGNLINDIKGLMLDLIGDNRIQNLPTHKDDGGVESDRFYRDGGYNFAKEEIRKKVKEL